MKESPVPEIVRTIVRATAAGVALFVGLVLAAAPSYAGDDHTQSPPAPSASPTSGGHEHGHEHGSEPAPAAPADVDEHEGHGGHTPPAEPGEPAERPRAWVFGGFAAVNGVALGYAAWLRRRTAADRARRDAARAAARTRGTAPR